MLADLRGQNFVVVVVVVVFNPLGLFHIWGHHPSALRIMMNEFLVPPDRAGDMYLSPVLIVPVLTPVPGEDTPVYWRNFSYGYVHVFPGFVNNRNRRELWRYRGEAGCNWG